MVCEEESWDDWVDEEFEVVEVSSVSCSCWRSSMSDLFCLIHLCIVVKDFRRRMERGRSKMSWESAGILWWRSYSMDASDIIFIVRRLFFIHDCRNLVGEFKSSLIGC